MRITVKEIKITPEGFEATLFWSNEDVKKIGHDPEWYLNNWPLRLIKRALEDEELEE